MTTDDERPGPQTRHGKRVATEECFLRLHVKVPLLVREISGGGALLESPVAVPGDSDGRLRTMLAGRPFETPVAVARTARAETDARKTRVGVSFGDMNGDMLQVLRHFLRLSAPGPHV